MTCHPVISLGKFPVWGGMIIIVLIIIVFSFIVSRTKV